MYLVNPQNSLGEVDILVLVPTFLKEETEAQKGPVICPRPRAQCVVDRRTGMLMPLSRRPVALLPGGLPSGREGGGQRQQKCCL